VITVANVLLYFLSANFIFAFSGLTHLKSPKIALKKHRYPQITQINTGA
jgi:hypothetical protein